MFLVPCWLIYEYKLKHKIVIVFTELKNDKHQSDLPGAGLEKHKLIRE